MFQFHENLRGDLANVPVFKKTKEWRMPKLINANIKPFQQRLSETAVSSNQNENINFTCVFGHDLCKQLKHDSHLYWR